MKLPDSDWQALRNAKLLLEKPSLAIKLTAAIGKPIEKGIGLLPQQWSEVLKTSTRASLEKALHFTMRTMKDKPGLRPADRLHKIMAVTTGAAGGAFGLPALLVELPVSTMVILRAIAAIARSEGEQIALPEVRLACLEVFALGGQTKIDNAAETGYFAVRSVLARNLSEAAKQLARGGISAKGAPAIVRFISQVASRFGVAVSEKAAAQALPLIGAAGGAVINSIFIAHFQDVAHGHFTVRRLERTYGRELVRGAYEEIII
jgi:hypothetical protein